MIYSTLFSSLVLLNSMAIPLCVFFLCSPQSLLRPGSKVARSNGRVQFKNLNSASWLKCRVIGRNYYWMIHSTLFNINVRVKLNFIELKDAHYLGFFERGVGNFGKKLLFFSKVEI